MQILPKKLIKFTIVLILLLIPLLFFAKEVYAEGYDTPSMQKLITDCTPDKTDPDKNNGAVQIIDTCILSRQFSGLIMATIKVTAGSCTPDPANYHFCITQDFNKSAIGSITNVMGWMYKNPPADFTYYARDFLANAGLATPAHAQGIGFTGLAPLLPLWKVARNLSYTVLVLVMVAIGFMIVFRMKIDPKTVISVQAALPKIIITLILITFSYAIAGFLIDMMYVAMAVVIWMISHGIDENSLYNSQLFTDPNLISNFLNGNIGTLFGSVFQGGLWPAFFGNAFGGSWTALIGEIGAALTGAVTAVVISAGVWQLAGVGSLLFAAIIFLGLLFTFIRIFLLLLNSYIQVLLSVILGPILLLQEAIPGKSAFSGWVKNLMANLVVFPTTVAIILLSWLFADTALTGNLWGPPFLAPLAGGSGNINIGNWSIPQPGGTVIPVKPGNPLAIFLGFGVMFLAPTLIASVKKLFSPKPALPITAGTAFSPLTGAVGTGMGAASQFYYMQQIAHVGAFSKILGFLGGNKPKEG